MTALRSALVLAIGALALAGSAQAIPTSLRPAFPQTHHPSRDAVFPHRGFYSHGCGALHPDGYEHCFAGARRATPSNELDVGGAIYPYILPRGFSAPGGTSSWVMFQSGSGANFIQAGQIWDNIRNPYYPFIFAAYSVNGVYHETILGAGDGGFHYFRIHRDAGTQNYRVYVDGIQRFMVTGLPSSNGYQTIFSEAAYYQGRGVCGNWIWQVVSVTFRSPFSADPCTHGYTPLGQIITASTSNALP